MREHVIRIYAAWFLIVGSPVFCNAEEKLAAVAEIEELGGLVYSIEGQWEVAFHLRGRNVSNEDLVHVAALKQITWLNLKQTKVTSAGLVHLKGLSELQSLHLEETAVGDEGLEHLASLPDLEYLNLYGTDITDAGLDKLASAKQLRQLYIWRTNATDEGVARLARALPRLKIVGGVDLSELPSVFPQQAEETKPKVSLKWIAAMRRGDAPERSENGVNCQVWFENKSGQPIKLYWISYGNGELKPYASLAPGDTHKQNTYSRNAWLITDAKDQPLGYFVAEEDNAHAVIPGDG